MDPNKNDHGEVIQAIENILAKGDENSKHVQMLLESILEKSSEGARVLENDLELHGRTNDLLEELIKLNGNTQVLKIFKKMIPEDIADVAKQVHERIRVPEDGKTPQRGVDYHTQDDIAAIVNEVQSRVKPAKDGETPQRGVDYFTKKDIDGIVREVVSLIPKPKDGEDAVIDYDLITKTVLASLPKAKENKQVEITAELLISKLKGVFSYNDLIDTPTAFREPKMAGTGYLREITDINLTNLTDGQSIRYDRATDRWVNYTPGSSGGSTNKVAVSSGDTTPGYLYDKLVAGTNVTLTQNNIGGDETITIDVATMTTAPAAPDYSIQFNDGAGAFGGSANLTFNDVAFEANRLALIGNQSIGDFSGGTLSISDIGNIVVGQLAGGSSIAVSNRGNGIFANADTNGQVINSGSGSLLVGNAEDSGLLQTGVTSAFSLGFVSGSGSTVQANGSGSIANGAVNNGGAIYSSGDGSVASGYATDANSQISSGGDGSYAMGGVFNGAQINSPGIGTIAAGYATDSGSTINSLSDGSIATGGAINGGSLSASANASVVHGFADGSSSIIQGQGIGSLAHGYATNNGGIINANSNGALAGGVADGSGSQIYASTQGGFSHGYADTAGQIQSNGSYASFAFGKAVSNSIISANDDGAMVSGSASNGSGLSSSGGGSLVHGLVNNGGTINTTGPGGHAFGWINGGGSGSGQGFITANGFGAVAGGSIDSTYGSNSQINSNATAFAWGFVNSGAQGIFANGNGAVAMGSSIDTGSIIEANTFGSLAIGAAFNGSALSAQGSGSVTLGRASSSSRIEGTGTANFVHGYADGANSKLSAQGNGDSVQGFAVQGAVIESFSQGAHASGSALGTNAIIAVGLNAVARGGFVHGYVADAGSQLLSDADGAVAFGFVSGNTGIIQASGAGSLAGGYTNAGTIQNTGIGSFVWGIAGSSGTPKGAIISNGDGNLVFGMAVGDDGASATSTLFAQSNGGDLIVGSALGGGVIRTSDNGSWAGGFSNGTDGAGNYSEIHSGRSSIAYGYANGGGAIEASSGFNGGSLAIGVADTGEQTKALGTAAFVLGQNITATGNNIYAFGKDFTNSVGSTFAVGFGQKDLVVSSGSVEVTGDIHLDAKLYDGSASAGSTGQILKSTGAATQWVDVSTFLTGYVPYSGASGNVDLGANDIIATNAHFTGKLTVDGPIDPTYIEYSEIATPGTPASAKNRVYFDSTTHLPKYINPAGTTFTFLTSASAVTSVYGRTGAVVAVSGDYTEAQISFTDITTNNVSTSKHGYVPKAPNTGTGFFLTETGAWSDASTNLYANNIIAGANITAGNLLLAGYVTRFGNIATAGTGVSAIYQNINLTGRTAAVTLFTQNTAALDAGFGTWEVSPYLTTTAISAGTLTIEVDYTDENNAAQTTTLIPMGLTSGNLTTTGNFLFPSVTIRVKASTNIVVKTNFTGVSTTYDVGCILKHNAFS